MHTVRRLRITQRFRSSNANADSSAIENLHFQNPPLIKNYAISALQIPQASVIALHARIGKFIMDATESENCEPMTQPATRRCGILIILSSPSGAGKTTLARKLIEWDPQIEFSVSATTRPPRPGETEGREYHFVSNEEFQRMIKQGELLEFASVFGNPVWYACCPSRARCPSVTRHHFRYRLARWRAIAQDRSFAGHRIDIRAAAVDQGIAAASGCCEERTCQRMSMHECRSQRRRSATGWITTMF